MSREEISRARCRFLTLLQFAVILAPFTFFLDSASLYRGRMNLSVTAFSILLFVMNVSLLLLTVLSVFSFAFYRKIKISSHQKDSRALRDRLFSCLPALFAAAAFSVFAAMQFDSIPQYDGGLYYDALITATEKFQFTAKSLLSSFTIFTHPMQGTCLFIGTGEMLFPRQAIGVYFVTLTVTLIAIFCLYGIIGRIFPEKDSWLKAAGTAVFAFCPYLLGLFSHVSPDYFLLMFFVILIYAFAEELDYLAAFLSLLLIFSKETGILFAASFLIPAMLIRAGKAEGKTFVNKLRGYIFPKRLLLYGIGPLLFFCYFIHFRGLSYGQTITNESVFRWDNNGVLCFGFNFGFISARLAQATIINFFWIVFLLFLAAFFLWIYRRFRNKSSVIFDQSADISLVCGIVLSSSVYLVFSCLFITPMCPRYNVCFALPLSLISLWAVCFVWKHQTIEKLLMSVLILLFLLQNYFNLDPSLIIGNRKIDMGYEYIYAPTRHYDYMDTSYIGELYVYNHTFTFSQDLLDTAMEKIKLNRNDHIMVVDVDYYELYIIGDPGKTRNLIYWDPIQKKRTYDCNAENAFLPQILSFTRPDFFSDRELDLPDDFYLILTAREDKTAYCKALEDRGFLVTDSFTERNYLGYLTVFHMKREIA